MATPLDAELSISFLDFCTRSIYLERALKEVRPTLPRPTTSFEEEIPNEVAYADDVNFFGQNYADADMDKTDFTSISESEEGWKEVKKVRSLIDDDKDVERRKQLATVALYKLNNVWVKGNKL